MGSSNPHTSKNSGYTFISGTIKNRKSAIRSVNEEQIPDLLLIQSYLNGDTDSFRILYDRYKNQIYSYLINMLEADRSYVDDIFQQTWIKIIRSLSRYQSRQKFLAWAMRIAHNLCIDYFRKKKFFLSSSNEEIIGSVPDSSNKTPWDEMDRKTLMKKLSNIIKELPNEQREVFLLRQDGISFKEIALIQNTSINTVLGRMQYALKKIQDKLTL